MPYAEHPLYSQEQLANGEPEVVARVVALEDSSVALKAWVWAKNPSD